MKNRTYFILLAAGLVTSVQIAFSQVHLEIVAENFSRPLAVVNAGDSRLFIVEQPGRIVILSPEGIKNPLPFLDISGKVESGKDEQGLLALAFHPQYATNGFFFVNYTGAGGKTFISRFTVSNSDPDIADPGSEYPILSFDQPFPNHNGGDLQFGPDGYLYISTGDGGSGGDPDNRSQDSTDILGKMLRIDIDSGSPYSIPESNPFKGFETAMEEIWALGLRNPWRFSFDRQTGDLWIGDVGQEDIEEINFQPASSQGGENYGWRCYEGSNSYNSQDCLGMENYVFPVFEIFRDTMNACSITGGFVYRGTKYPSMNGYYIFADYCLNRIWTLHDNNGSWRVTDQGLFKNAGLSSFGEDMHGELYAAGLWSGAVYRIGFTEIVGIETEMHDKGIKVYPNPATNQLWIETRKQGGTEVQVDLYKPNGNLLYHKSSTEPLIELNLEELSQGIYFLGITQNGLTEFQKIIRQ